MIALDMLDRKMQVGDYVVHYNHIYEILEIPARGNGTHAYVKVILVNRSKTTRSMRKYSREMCLLPADAVTEYFKVE